MDPSSASSSAIAKTENYLYFDPRSANARGAMPPSSSSRNLQAGSAVMPGGLGSAGPGTGATFGQRRQGFNEAIVFAVGGGSMEEYGNLQDWARRTGGQLASGSGGAGGTPGGSSGAGIGSGSGLSGSVPQRRVVYGSTELVNAGDFLTESLAKLGLET
jgi:hypothetical protein